MLRTPVASVSAVRVEPGTYAGVLEWNYSSESMHSDIASPADYPAGEGPDGIVWLRRIA